MRLPVATLSLIVANLAAFRIELAEGGLETCYAHGLAPAKFLATGDAAPVLSSMFLHDPGTVLHLGCNMAFLAFFGTVVEREIGALRFLVLFLAAGILGGLMHIAVAPGATEPLVGASGAVFGVVAVAAVLRPRLLGFAVALGAVEVFHAFTGGVGTVSFGCHIGGLVAGALFGALWRDDAVDQPA
jgi:membrane associated rhomboid family serine protease